jgi:hypothetical protein
MTRDAGAEGSGWSNGTFDPAVVNAFKVLNFRAVLGLQSHESTTVLCCSALLLANSKASKVPHASRHLRLWWRC